MEEAVAKLNGTETKKSKAAINPEREYLRETLANAAREKKIPHKQDTIKNATPAQLIEMEKELKKVNMKARAEKLTEFVLIRTPELLHYLKLVKDPKELEREYKNSEILVQDLNELMTGWAPWIPYIGIIDAIFLTTKVVYNDTRKVEKQKESICQSQDTRFTSEKEQVLVKPTVSKREGSG